jgi:hypothetical protein
MVRPFITKLSSLQIAVYFYHVVSLSTFVVIKKTTNDLEFCTNSFSLQLHLVDWVSDY